MCYLARTIMTSDKSGFNSTVKEANEDVKVQEQEVEEQEELEPLGSLLADLPSSDEGEADSRASSGDSSEEEQEAFRFGWSKRDMATLFTRIRRTIPRNDRVNCVTRLQKVDWGRVAFGGHPPVECKDVWMKVQQKMRKYRSLSEVLHEVKNTVHTGKLVTNYMCHPEKPTAPKSAYTFFVQDIGQKIRMSHPRITSRELMPMLSARYMSLSEDEKQKYVKMAEESSKEYRANKAKFMHKHPDYVHSMKDVKNIKIVSQSSVDNNLVKTPFNIYLAVQRKKHGALTDMEELQLMQDSERSWKQIDDDERMFWINWAEERFIVYKQEHPDDRKVSLRSILSRSEMKIRNEYSKKPVDMPCSGAALFAKKLLANEQVKNLHLPFEDSMEFARLCWSRASDKDRAVFRQYVEDVKKRYVEERAEYIENLPTCEKFIELHRPFELKGLGNIDSVEDVPVSTKKQKGVKRKRKQATKKKEPSLPENTIEEYYSNLQKLRMRTSTWDECPKKEKMVHMKNWLEKKHKYIVDYKEFLESLDRDELQEYIRNINTMQEVRDSSSSSEGSDDGF